MGYNLDSFNNQTELENIIESYFSPQCDDWVAKDNEDPPDFSDVSPPPCKLDQAHNDPMFVTDSACTQDGNICGLRPGAHQCIKSRTARWFILILYQYLSKKFYWFLSSSFKFIVHLLGKD